MQKLSLYICCWNFFIKILQLSKIFHLIFVRNSLFSLSVSLHIVPSISCFYLLIYLWFHLNFLTNFVKSLTERFFHILDYKFSIRISSKKFPFVYFTTNSLSEFYNFREFFISFSWDLFLSPFFLFFPTVWLLIYSELSKLYFLFNFVKYFA